MTKGFARTGEVPDDDCHEKDELHSREEKARGQHVTIGERELQRDRDQHGKQDRPARLPTDPGLRWLRGLLGGFGDAL